MLQMPGAQDIEAIKKVVGKVAKWSSGSCPLPEERLEPSPLKIATARRLRSKNLVQMTGRRGQECARRFRAQRQLEVSLSLRDQGARDFARITGANVGRNLAIILDGVVYSSPEIRERIGGGVCSITGGFTMEEARQLAVVLCAGALPAPLKIMEERTVGPSLGQESIAKGIRGSLLGCVLITVWMLVYYRKSGLVAVGSLVVNVFLLLAVLSGFGATLTLPGLAGLALTVGMAVDANVVIYERIREEIRNGCARDAAVRLGFEKALSP